MNFKSMNFLVLRTNLNDIGQFVCLDQPLSVFGNTGSLDRVDLPGSGLLGEEAEDSGSGAHVQHHLVSEVSHVGQNGLLISGGANVILHHVLLLGQITVKLEILHGRGVFCAGVEHRSLAAGSAMNN